MREKFKLLLQDSIEKDKRIKIVTADLGYKMWDSIRDTYPENFINVGASEQLLLGACIGLSYEGYIPIAYSITPFTIYRPLELIRNYLHNEGAKVKLVGSGIGKDYQHDGFSHHDFTSKKILDVLNITCYSPQSESDLCKLYDNWLYEDKPSFLGLRR